jgi:hypothetical protein
MSRSPVAGLIVGLVIVVLALLVAFVAAVGIAFIGLLLSRWFDLTQWQGSLIALAALGIVGLLAYRLIDSPTYSEPEWLDFDYEDPEPEPAEPPIVPWRRQRPTQGQPPVPPEKKR